MRGHNRWLLAAGLAIGTLGMASVANAQAPLDTTFSYQGQLKSGLNLVEVNSDFRFTVWDSSAGGVQIAGPVTRSNVLVRDGVFSVNLDFGATPFNGENRYLQIEVRSPAGAGAFTTLTPRQKMQATPYAQQAQSGNAPFNIQAPGSTSSVFINPDGGTFVRANRAGVSESTLRTNGGRGSGLQFNAANSDFAAFMGSDARDGQGFVGLYPTLGGTLDGTVDIDADDDNDPANGISNGAIDIRSIGTGGAGGLVRLRNNDNAITFLGAGGASAAGANLNLYDPNTQNSVLQLTEVIGGGFVNGGTIQMFRPDGTRFMALEPDFSGDGGFLSVSSGSGAFYVDGNGGAGGGPGVTISGPTSAATFNTNVAGDASVNLPSNAISAGEILDEPGLANNHTSGISVPAGSTGTITSRTITVPAAGFVLAIANADLQFAHVAGASDFYNFGISTTSTTLPGDQDQTCGIPAGAAAGFYNFSASAHGVFSVAAGANTFFFNAAGFGAAATMFDIQFTLVYLPTAYGTVVSNFTGEFAADNTNRGPTFPAMSPSQISGERAMGEQFNQARLLKEFNDMQVRMESLRKQMEATLGQQSKGAAKPSKTPVRDESRSAVEPVAINTSSEGK